MNLIATSKLTQISDPDSTYRYTYDLDGRMLTAVMKVLLAFQLRHDLCL
jgi:YD repeat-containing protein